MDTITVNGVEYVRKYGQANDTRYNDVNKACEEHSLMSWEINPERTGQ